MVSKKEFIKCGNKLNHMMKYPYRDDIFKVDRERKDAIIAIFDELKKKKKHVDNTDLIVHINGILSGYIMIERTTENHSDQRIFEYCRLIF